MMLLEVTNVAKDYGTNTPVLRNVNLQVASGKSLAIVGASGSGKSTLLNIIGTLDRPSSGCVVRSEERRVGKECRL